MPFIAFAAAETQSSNGDASDAAEFRVINSDIDSWAQGTVSKISDGEVVIQGNEMPAATVHAQMRHEVQQKLAGVDDPQKRLQIARQVKEQWRDKFEAAAKENKGAEKAMTFKAPSDAKSLVILDSDSFRKLPFFQKMASIKEAREKMGLEERDLVELYNARQDRLAAREERREERSVPAKFEEKVKEAAEKISEKAKERVEAARETLFGERLSLSNLKQGDKVFVGFDSDNNTAFTIIRKD
jgi:hypothetical protein